MEMLDHQGTYNTRVHTMTEGCHENVLMGDSKEKGEWVLWQWAKSSMVHIIKNITSTWGQALHILGIPQCFIIVLKIQEGQKRLGELGF